MHIEKLIFPFQKIGHSLLKFLQVVGKVTNFTFSALIGAFQKPFYAPVWGRYALDIGFYSLPLIGLTAIFTGMVLALQSYTGLNRMSAGSAVADLVVVAICRELGPVLGGLMVAGRMSAAIAAEIASMRVSEQINALVTLSANPLKYLVTPRLWMGLILLPILVLTADTIGIFGGYIVATGQLDFSSHDFLNAAYRALKASDVISGLVKASAFGLVITLCGTYQGFHSDKGARGVGEATTNAVVYASIAILCVNFILTALFFSK